MLFFVALVGCTTLEQRANGAAVADTVTTAGALALGATELNPVNWATIPIKLATLLYCKTLPEDEKAQCHATVGPIWGGAAVNNLCVVAMILTGGAFMPVCIAGGIGYGVYAWNESAPEREFYAGCTEYRRVSGGTFRCIYQLQSEE